MLWDQDGGRASLSCMRQQQLKLDQYNKVHRQHMLCPAALAHLKDTHDVFMSKIGSLMASHTAQSSTVAAASYSESSDCYLSCSWFAHSGLHALHDTTWADKVGSCRAGRADLQLSHEDVPGSLQHLKHDVGLQVCAEVGHLIAQAVAVAQLQPHTLHTCPPHSHLLLLL